jgi:hypothetical protein
MVAGGCDDELSALAVKYLSSIFLLFGIEISHIIYSSSLIRIQEGGGSYAKIDVSATLCGWYSD